MEKPQKQNSKVISWKSTSTVWKTAQYQYKCFMAKMKRMYRLSHYRHIKQQSRVWNEEI